MRFSQAQVAALVLGYLRGEKLQDVANEFVKRCPHFENDNIKMGKYFATRVAGMRLIDFLQEYAVISSIVESRVEETNYYETHNRTSLVEQLLFILDKEVHTVATSTPVSSEVETTPSCALPGHCPVETDSSSQRTPKKRNSMRNKSLSEEEREDDMMDITEVLTQSLLEHKELHEKIAENINLVRSTPENSTNEEQHISSNASKELDAVIKTVVQKTEEDPMYHRLIDEIIGSATTNEVPTPKKSPYNTRSTNQTHQEPTTSTTPEKCIEEDENAAAVRSIMVESTTNDPESSQRIENGDVYVFEGTLDTYLKTSGLTMTSYSNPPVYLNQGNVVVVPPDPEPTKQFYIVNNPPPPVLKMSERELMSIPTIIVNDPVPINPENRKTRVIVPKRSNNNVSKPLVTATPSTRPTVAPHVRNLDFSSPKFPVNIEQKKDNTWDSALRELVQTCTDKSPLKPKRRKSQSKKITKKSVSTKEKSKKTEQDDEVPTQETIHDVEKVQSKTPVKEEVQLHSKDPLLHCTPFNDVICDQLKGVDLTAIDTPSIPITPGFPLTPGEMLQGYNHRGTDYSTSSSYYQPSDPEQGKSLEQIMDEVKDKESPPPTPCPKETKLHILSDVVIGREEVITATECRRISVTEHRKKFNNCVIGKKNLSLIKQNEDSEDSSDDEDEEIICEENVNVIKDIIGTVEVKSTLDEDAKKALHEQLEEKRKRTVEKIKSEKEKKPSGRGRKKGVTNKKKVTPKTTKGRKKKKEVIELEKEVEEEDDEAEKLVKGLAQRGIHLIPKKTPQKPKVVEVVTKNDSEELLEKRTFEEVEPKVVEVVTKDDSEELFERRTFEECETVVREDKRIDRKKKNLKTYDVGILNKTLSVEVFMDDLNEKVSRELAWTKLDCLLSLGKSPRTKSVEDDLMDFAIIGSSKPGGRKRKSKSIDSEMMQADKRSKDIKHLLKTMDVDDFLDKVHG